MFNLIDRYILGNFLVAMGLSIFALAGMFWLGQSIGLIDEIVLRGETIWTFLNLSSKLIPKILLNIIPVAALAAALFAMNAMANNAELVVMSATGMRPLRMVRPIAIIGILLSLLLYILAFQVAPKSSFDLRKSLREIENNYSSNVILSGRFVFPVRNVTVFAGDSLLSGEMLNLFIEDRRERPLIRSYYAERGVYLRQDETMMLALINGDYHEHNIKTNTISRAHFDRTEIVIDNALPEKKALTPWRNETPSAELFGYFNSEHREFFIGEIANRLFYPTLGFVLPVLAVLIFEMAPFSRHGYGRPIAIAAASGLLLTALQLALPNLAETNIMLMWLGFIPLIVVFGVYIFAIRRGY